MPDNAAVGFWVRRFLSDHLIHERGVSRNTQQSYRDTFCLFLPFVAARLKTAVDKLIIDDLSPGIVSEFLAHLEQIRRVPFKRTWTNPVPYMEKDEIDELLRAPNRAIEHGQRDCALLLFLY